jgi:hypothetical protein
MDKRAVGFYAASLAASAVSGTFLWITLRIAVRGEFAPGNEVDAVKTSAYKRASSGDRGLGL